MNPEYINIPAVIAVAVLPFLLGGLWYSPVLFGTAWMGGKRFY